MKIMFSAGEASGDLHGATLAAAIRRLDPEADLIGFGGPQMAAAGVRLAADMRDYSVMGFWEVLLNLRRMFRLRDQLTAFMAAERPALLVLIDYPDFNWRLAAEAKKLGIPVFSYIPPSAWAWRKGRAKKCAALADELVAIFPFELPVYEAAGAKISFQGNPLVDTVKSSMDPAAARQYFGLQDGERAMLLLPGSRRQEIQLLLPVMLAAARRMQAEVPQLRFYLPVAPGIERAGLEQMAADAGITVRFTTAHTYDLMRLAELAIATSGTVVLDRMSPVSYAIGKLLVHVENFSRPNILAGHRIEPELLQAEVNPERIQAEARRFYADSAHTAAVRAALAAAVASLGEPGAAERVARRILAAAQGSREKLGKLSGDTE